jgi:hypothetical protein
LSEFTQRGEIFDFDTFTLNKNHIIKIQGIQKHNATMDRLAGVLYAYVINWIKNTTELPIEVCTSTCLESLKGTHKMNASLKALQQKYDKIIKDFDTS